MDKMNLTVVAEPEGSTPLIPKLIFGHDPEPILSASHPHNLFTCVLHLA
jgi:hypothetical protein